MHVTRSLTPVNLDERWAGHGRAHRVRAIDEIALDGFIFAALLPARAGAFSPKKEKQDPLHSVCGLCFQELTVVPSPEPHAP